MPSKPIPTAKVVLACQHKIELTLPLPSMGDLQFCETCDAYLAVESVPEKWEARCMSRRGCYHTVSNSEHMALRRAQSHVDRKHHVIEVRHDGRSVHRWEPVEGWYQPWHPRLNETT